MGDLQAVETNISKLISDNSANDAPAWMLNRLDGSHHPALNTNIPDLGWESSKNAFAIFKDTERPDKAIIYEQAEAQKSAFIETVVSYNNDARRYGNMEMDIHGEHTWDEVLSVQLALSQERDAETSKGFKGFFHKNMRRFGDNSESLQPWLKLLPTESHYLSVLCGGLSLVLGAAHRMSELRESIRNVIDDIPSTLSKVKDYIKVFEDSPEIHKCSADLYVAILSTLDLVVRQYQKHVARRISSAIFKQSMSGKELQDKIKTIKACGDNLAYRANIEFLERQKLDLAGAKDMTKLMISSTRRQDHGFTTIAFQNEELSEALQSQGKELSSHSKDLQFIKQALNDCVIFLRATPVSVAPADRIKNLESKNPTEGYLTPRSRSPSPNAAIEREHNQQQLRDLLGRLSIDDQSDVAAKDAPFLMNLIHTLSLASQYRAVTLIKSPILQEWLTKSESGPLHINGNMFSHQNETRQSPLSFFCAKLIDSVLHGAQTSRSRARKTIFAVRWFCGQHADMVEDYDAHPTGMLNNLVAQLINQLLDFPNTLTLPNPPDLPGNGLQCSELCEIFVLLAETLPPGTVLFCIIDGISYYEDKDRRAECTEVLSMLTSLTRRSHDATQGCLIKLLITTPLRSRCAQELFMVNEVLEMDEYIPPNGGFSALQWDLGVERVIG